MLVKVNARTQVNFEGRLHGEGDRLEVPDADARAWVAAGYVSEVERPARRRPSLVPGRSSRTW